MKNKIKRFAKGDFHIPQPEIIFPETHIVMRVGEGEKYRGSFSLKNQGEGTIRGLVYPSSYRVQCDEQGFDGNPVNIYYTYDGSGLMPGHVEHGKFTIVCNGGEYDVAFTAIIEKPYVMTSYGKIQSLDDFKKLSFEDIAAFIQLSAEQHGVQVGGNKGNVTLFSFDGKYKIVRQSQESIRFDESLQAAKALIDECISEWAAGSNDNIRVLINDAFQVDKEGKISTGRVLSLRRLDIRDEKWLRAMDAISDSIIVTDSKNYVRFYERDSEGKYQAISLDFANV